MHLRPQQRVLVGVLPLLPGGPLGPRAGKLLRLALGGPVSLCHVLGLRLQPLDQPPGPGSCPGSSQPATHSGNRSPAMAARRPQYFYEGLDGQDVVVGPVQVRHLDGLEKLFHSSFELQ